MANKNKKSSLLDFDLTEMEVSSPEEVPAGDRVVATEKLEVVKKILQNLQLNLDKAIRILSESYEGDSTLIAAKLEEIKTGLFEEKLAAGEAEVVEGVFDGQKMIGADGKEYQVPANYASKSKLVEGDILKLTIDLRGNFIYKQIGPIERKRIKTTLYQDKETKQFYAVAGQRRWKLLTAAATYFKGSSGDEVVILVPKDSKSQWAAIENVVKK